MGDGATAATGAPAIGRKPPANSHPCCLRSPRPSSTLPRLERSKVAFPRGQSATNGLAGREDLRTAAPTRRNSATSAPQRTRPGRRGPGSAQNRALAGSGRASQQDDGKVRSPFQVPHLEREPHARPTVHGRLRPGAARGARPSRPGFEAWPMMRRQPPEVDLLGRRTRETGMRSLAVVPDDEE